LKIEDVEAIPLFAPVENLPGPPFQVHHGDELTGVLFSGYRTCLVRIRTDTGIVGIGECGSRFSSRAAAVLVDELRPVLLGKDPMASDYLWGLLYEVLRSGGHRAGFYIEALSGIDIALWDIRGKAVGLPVYALLGGPHRRTLPVYGAALTLSMPPESLAQRTAVLLERGYEILKAKIGADARDPQRELDTLAGLCEGFRGRVRFVVDANGMYDYSVAVRVGRSLERMPVLWLEEPLSPDDRPHQAELARQLDIAVAGGESEFTAFGFRDVLVSGVYDIIQPNVSRAGGISECWRIAALAQAFRVPVAFHVGSSSGVCIAATLQLAAACRNFLIYEHMGPGWSPGAPNPFRDALVGGPVDQFEHGTVKVPDRPGLGVDLREDVVQAYRVRSGA
jgi:D-arabinonate dehydratase/D-galactarolactone cycloisomerase